MDVPIVDAASGDTAKADPVAGGKPGDAKKSGTPDGTTAASLAPSSTPVPPAPWAPVAPDLERPMAAEDGPKRSAHSSGAAPPAPDGYTGRRIQMRAGGNDPGRAATSVTQAGAAADPGPIGGAALPPRSRAPAPMPPPAPVAPSSANAPSASASGGGNHGSWGLVHAILTGDIAGPPALAPGDVVVGAAEAVVGGAADPGSRPD
ncbi:hypothetical protein [Blastococcus tunisiensis]|uniref:hypothetical protein n=1 Tax=Blastococcus tunisiensis TaxID=1798228 RepID=UPI00111460BE|nr:hypothetical protein [Blastococcus sp. DSM 46838]